MDDILLSGSTDKTVKVWNLRETPYTNLATLHGHQDGVLSLTVKDRTVFSGSGDKSIFVIIKFWILFYIYIDYFSRFGI